jgi:hypothetical protein
MRVTIKKITKNKIAKDTVDVIMLGRVVPSGLTKGDELFDNQDPDLRIHIKPLCKEPMSFRNISEQGSEDNNYVLFGTKIKKIEEITKSAVLNEESEKELHNYLEKNFFVYKPYINFKEASSVNTGAGIVTIEVHKNVSGSLTTIPIGSYNPDAQYIRLPKINLTLPDLALSIDRGSKIDLVNYPASLSNPEYILFDDYIVQFSSGNISTNDAQGIRWFLGGDINQVKIHALTAEDLSYIIGTGTYISFIDSSILYSMDFSTTLLQELEHIKSNSFIESEIVQHVDELSPEKEVENISVPDSMEITFLKGLCESCQRDGLLYKPQDLVNFHVSIKTNFLTILTGATGTGKSQLAVKYAEHLCNTNKLVIPVETSFLESDDVIGYLNISNGIYHASRTGLVDFLLDAGHHEDKMYVVIFDEMNLAQVEHWFAPFISLLEQKEKTLKLYSGFCMNGDRYPEKLKITNNVRFIGTINLDETVKELSDRLLDRTNLVELHKPSFTDIIELDTDPHLIEGTNPILTAGIYHEWIRKEDTTSSSLNKDDIQMFEKLTELIENIDHRKGVSFRVLQCINHYINNIPSCSNPTWTITKEEALDLQISQRIISKFKGTPQSLRGLITPADGQENKCPLLNFFNDDTYKPISNFKRTKSIIQRKDRELKSYGYTY